MSEAVDADDAKLVTLARAARARNATAEGAAVRDDTGRTYVATTVGLSSLPLSALQAAVVIAVASGAEALEAAAVVSSGTEVRPNDLSAVADLTPGAPVFLAGLDGAVHHIAKAT
jgi:acetylornithine/succinyldiaminopimelate/putrescine aminotransferase